MKKIWVGVVILIIAALAVSLIVNQAKRGPEEIRIGAILPLTGDAAVYGQEMKKGIDLAVEEVNRTGGINGKKITIVYEDDQGQANTAVNSFQKLIFQDKVEAVIGGAISSTAMPIAPIAERNKVVLISPAASSPALTNAGKFIFRVWPSDVFEASEIAKFAYQRINLRKVSIVYVNNDYGKGASEIFKREFEKIGGVVPLIEGYEFGNTDFRATLSKVKETHSEGVYIPGYQKELINILKQAKELGLKVQFLGGVGFNDLEILRLAGDAAEGTIFTAPYYDPKSSDPTIQKFVAEFMAKYGKEPDIFAAHSYDALRVLIEAMKKGGIKGTEIQKSLIVVKNYPGVTGTITFDSNGDVIKPLRFYTVKGGQFIVYGE